MKTRSNYIHIDWKDAKKLIESGKMKPKHRAKDFKQ